MKQKNDNLLNNIIRTGIVTEVNYKNCTVRVLFSDEDDIVSDELPVLMTSCVGNKDKRLPAKGDAVVCMFMPFDVSIGWCLGAYYNDVDVPPDNSADTEIKQFSDGTVVSYNTKKHTMIINCTSAGVINVTAKTATLKADKAIVDGDLTVTGSISADKEITSRTKVSAPDGEFGAVGANGGGLKVNGKDWLEHRHSAGELMSPHGSVTGSTGEGST